MPQIEVPETPTGLDLQIARMRIRPRVTQQAVADKMGRPRGWIAELEGRLAPSPEDVKAYLEALQAATIRDVATLEKAG